MNIYPKGKLALCRK